MTENRPITPPPELVQQWDSECESDVDAAMYLAIQAARWGADQELEACCEWVSQWRCMVGGNRPEVGLRAARRPNPPSLKEQALQALDCLCVNHTKATAHENTIRRALEQLDD